MILFVPTFFIFQILTLNSGIPYVTDKPDVQRQNLALIGKLGANQNLRLKVQRIVNTIYESDNLIHSYFVDCDKSNVFCKAEDESELQIYSFGRVIHYVGRNQEEDILSWIRAISQRQLLQINNKQQLSEVIEKNKFGYVFFPSQNSQDYQMFVTLSRKYLVTPMFLVKNPSLMEELEVKPGNITMFKNSKLQKQTFTHTNSWQRWESFLATYSFPGINYLDSNNLVNDRFRDNTDIKFVGVFIDHSYRAQSNIDVFYDFSRNNSYEIEMRLYLDYLRQSQMIKVYYHIRPKSFPALVYVRLVNQKLKVSVKEGAFTSKDLEQFIQKAVNDQLEPFYLSQQIPQNNGYSGKGVEKTIQKTVYNNFHKLVIEGPKTYVVMYTSVGQGCGNCEDSWTDFKKLKSYLEDEDIVFAKYDFVNNYIPEPIISTIPQVVIYKAGSKDKPITSRYLSRFDPVLNLIREHIPLQNDEL